MDTKDFGVMLGGLAAVMGIAYLRSKSESLAEQLSLDFSGMSSSTESMGRLQERFGDRGVEVYQLVERSGLSPEEKARTYRDVLSGAPFNIYRDDYRDQLVVGGRQRAVSLYDR